MSAVAKSVDTSGADSGEERRCGLPWRLHVHPGVGVILEAGSIALQFAPSDFVGFLRVADEGERLVAEGPRAGNRPEVPGRWEVWWCQCGSVRFRVGTMAAHLGQTEFLEFAQIARRVGSMVGLQAAMKRPAEC